MSFSLKCYQTCKKFASWTCFSSVLYPYIQLIIYLQTVCQTHTQAPPSFPRPQAPCPASLIPRPYPASLVPRPPAQLPTEQHWRANVRWFTLSPVTYIIILRIGSLVSCLLINVAVIVFAAIHYYYTYFITLCKKSTNIENLNQFFSVI